MTECERQQNQEISDRWRSPGFEIGGRGVRLTSSNISGLDGVSGLPHEMPHEADPAPQNMPDLARSLRFRARRKPWQQLAGELAMNLTYYAEHPTPELWGQIKSQFEQLEHAIGGQ